VTGKVYQPRQARGQMHHRQQSHCRHCMNAPERASLAGSDYLKFAG
jgi:hypothetical protein